MSTQAPYSGVSVPVRMPGNLAIWRRTSRTTAPAALPTASMLKAVKIKGSSPPMNRPMMTFGSFSGNESHQVWPVLALSKFQIVAPKSTSAARPAEAMA